MRHWCVMLLAGAAAVVGCDRGAQAPTTSTAPAAAARGEERSLPEVDMSKLPFEIQKKIGAARTVARGPGADVRAFIELGAMYYAYGQPAAAAQCFQYAAELEPLQPPPWYFIGLALTDAGDIKGAIAAFEKSVLLKADYDKQHPEEPQGVYQSARVRIAALLLGTDNARAADLFRKVLEAEPDNAAAQYGLGRVAEAAGKLDEAVQLYRAALMDAPNYGPAHGALARVLAAQGHQAEADAHVSLASKDDGVVPTGDTWEYFLRRAGYDVQALQGEIVKLLEAGQAAQAGSLADSLIELEDTATAQNLYGRALMAQGRLDEGVRAFRAGLKLDPQHHPSKLNLALALAGKGEFPEAEQLVNEVLTEQPRNFQAVERLIAIKELQQKPDEALPALRRALELSPDSAVAHLRGAELLLRLKHQDDALLAVRKAIELEPTHAPAHSQLAMALLARGDREGAKAEFREALRLDPGFIPARGALAEVLVREKQYAEAEPLLREGMKLAPRGGIETAALSNALAWLLATSPIAEQRKGEEAVELALAACRATDFKDPGFLDTLAAAYAEAGRFTEARQRQGEAIRLMQALNRAADVAEYRERLALYEKQQPYHLE